MNRIAQRQFSSTQVELLEALHASFTRALSNHVPPSVSSLYATPRVESTGVVQWYTSFAGQPVAYTDLPERSAESLRELLFQRLRAIKQFTGTYALQPNHDPALLKILLAASADPPIESIYSVGGQPVLLFWDSAIPTEKPRKTLPIPIIPIATTAAAVTTLGRAWKWLAALLLLLLILFLLWWFWCTVSPFNQKPAAIQPTEAEPRTALTTPTPLAPVSPPEPISPLKPADPPEPEHIPKPEDPPVVDPEPDPEPEPIPEPAPEPEPVPEPPKPVPQPPRPTPKPVVKPPATITTAKNLCPDDRPPTLAPEMVVVFDSSGSMLVNVNATREEEQWVFGLLNRNPLALQFMTQQDRQRLQYLTRQPTRMVTAQQATIDVLRRLPSDVGTGLVVVDACSAARNLGRYAPTQRGQMMNQLRGLQPHQGTPLADGILEAGRLVDGVNKESTILLVSDGGESCGGDPCMVARNLAKQKPHLKINVVDIGGSGAAACVAQATGGKVYSVSNIAELNAGINRAAQDVLGPSTCKK